MRPKQATVNHEDALHDPSIPFAENRLLQLLLLLFIVLWVVAAIRPTDRLQWAIENVLPVATAAALIVTYRKFAFSNLSYLLMFLFLCTHLFAAHYTYQNTPVDVWLKAAFHTERSYFDRFVHFLFGLMLAYPCREWLIRCAGIGGGWAYALPVSVVFASSALFEIIEMGAALFGGSAGGDYIGLQGDIYDTQKDMALGLAGGLAAMGALAWADAAKDKAPWEKRRAPSRVRR